MSVESGAATVQWGDQTTVFTGLIADTGTGPVRLVGLGDDRADELLTRARMRNSAAVIRRLLHQLEDETITGRQLGYLTSLLGEETESFIDARQRIDATRSVPLPSTADTPH